VFEFEKDGAMGGSFQSVPRTFWWAVVTMTTVGYGDMYPVTGLGKAVGVVTMFCGMIVLALPITVIGQNFSKQYELNAFQQGVIRECAEKKGGINLEKLLSFMRNLDARGNLRVPLPESPADLQQVLIQGGYMHENGKVDGSDWQALIHDFVLDASDFQGATIQKMLMDMRDAQDALQQLHQRVEQFSTTGERQYDALIALLRRVAEEAQAPPRAQAGNHLKGDSGKGGNSTARDGSALYGPAIAAPIVERAISSSGLSDSHLSA